MHSASWRGKVGDRCGAVVGVGSNLEADREPDRDVPSRCGRYTLSPSHPPARAMKYCRSPRREDSVLSFGPNFVRMEGWVELHSGLPSKHPRGRRGRAYSGNSHTPLRRHPKGTARLSGTWRDPGALRHHASPLPPCHPTARRVQSDAGKTVKTRKRPLSASPTLLRWAGRGGVAVWRLFCAYVCPRCGREAVTYVIRDGEERRGSHTYQKISFT
jgi:hypothetical protein